MKKIFILPQEVWKDSFETGIIPEGYYFSSQISDPNGIYNILIYKGNKNILNLPEELQWYSAYQMNNKDYLRHSEERSQVYGWSLDDLKINKNRQSDES